MQIAATQRNQVRSAFISFFFLYYLFFFYDIFFFYYLSSVFRSNARLMQGGDSSRGEEAEGELILLAAYVYWTQMNPGPLKLRTLALLSKKVTLKPFFFYFIFIFIFIFIYLFIYFFCCK